MSTSGRPNDWGLSLNDQYKNKPVIVTNTASIPNAVFQPKWPIKIPEIITVVNTPNWWEVDQIDHFVARSDFESQ